MNNTTFGLTAYVEREIQRISDFPDVDLPRLEKLHSFLTACTALESNSQVLALQNRVDEMLRNTLKSRAKAARQYRAEFFKELSEQGFSPLHA